MFETSNEAKDLRKAQGRWPEFALELTRHCQQKGLRLPAPLGDCRKEQMPAEVVNFLDKTLAPLLARRPPDAARMADLEALNKAQGRWPEYPREIIDLAKKYKLPVPGWTLPGQPQIWERFRAGKKRP